MAREKHPRRSIPPVCRSSGRGRCDPIGLKMKRGPGSPEPARRRRLGPACLRRDHFVLSLIHI
eukprot:8121668-Pyramimonas_sp.AAC.1